MRKLLTILYFTCISFGVFANAIVTQKDWRWRKDNGSETTADWTTAQDQGITAMVCDTGNVRLRISFQVDQPSNYGVSSYSKSVDWHLSYSNDPNGSFTQIATTGNTDFLLVTSLLIKSGASTTQQLTGSTAAFAPGVIIDANTQTEITFSTPSNVSTMTEMEWVLKPNHGIKAQTYYFKLTGADNVSTLPSLNINTPATGMQKISTCSSYMSPSGKYLWTKSGVYQDTIPSKLGCDSVVITTLTLLGSADSVLKAACESYKSPSGKYLWTKSGIYKDTIANYAGCDSVITTNLTVSYSTQGDTSAIACDSFTWYGKSYTASDTYTHAFVNAQGCDSIVSLHLTINTADASVSLDGNIITAMEASQYVWIDCLHSNDTIPNETSQTFVAEESGSYGVIVTNKGCSKMSECTMLLVTSTYNSSSALSALKLHPNPSNGSFVIEVAAAAEIEIYNPTGQVLLKKSIPVGMSSVELSNIENGVYYITSVDRNGNSNSQKLVITK